MHTVYLGLGSNLGAREAHLQAALDRLPAPGLRLLRVSSLYETAPLDYVAQPAFWNLVVEAVSDLMPLRLLAHVNRIERALGRTRAAPKGPRTIDIDILLYGSFVVRAPKLEIPHPRFAQRRFVLEPLAELAPDLREPVSHRTVRELLKDVTEQTVRKTEVTLRLPPAAPAR